MHKFLRSSAHSSFSQFLRHLLAASIINSQIGKKIKDEMWLLWVAIMLVAAPTSQRMDTKVESFVSPRFELEPGSVANKYFIGIDFPKGHIAVKGFDAEVVDEEGKSVPLHQTYLHHWLVAKYMITDEVVEAADRMLPVWNSGVCAQLPQYFGLGAETRKTNTSVPDPYGIEVGNSPPGFEEGWMLNLHAIDTRGTAENKQGCAECRCDLYNVTKDEEGRGLGDYPGGLKCCYDGARCRVKQGFQGEKRGLYLKYSVTYVDWNPSIDLTLHRPLLNALDGRVLCNSLPIYGNETEPGNEDGYLIGMSTCYPQPGSIKIAPMEKLTITSNYSNVQMHTGVMGYYYILVAEPLTESNPIFHSLDVADMM